MRRRPALAATAQAQASTQAQEPAWPATSRRRFLQVTALAGGGLLASWATLAAPDARAQPAAGTRPLQASPFVRLAPDGTVTLLIGSVEMGQGAATAMPMLIAEELDADWSRVRWEQAPAGEAYRNPLMHQQVTGGSLTVIGQFEPHRRAGAAVRELLVAAAAQRWGVAADSLRTERSRVHHAASGRSVGYEELLGEAARLPLPANPRLKDPKDFKLIGQSVQRLDAVGKSDGSARFGMDAQVPGLLTALIARAPLFGGKVARFDASAARAMLHVVGIHAVPDGVAVVASDYWSAWRAREALKLEFDPVAGERISSDAQRAMYRNLMALEGTVARLDGGGAAGDRTRDRTEERSRTLTADYWFPYLTHAPMEPLNATIDWRGGDSAEAWMSTQWPEGDRAAIARVLGLAPERVGFHTLLAGGGFGRRSSLGFDVATAAAHVAKAVRRPVKVVWTRDQDIRGGYYRPSAYHRLSAAWDAQGRIVRFSDRIAVQSIAADTVAEGSQVKNGVDDLSVEGSADMAYAFEHLLVDLHSPRFQVPVLWMRSVGHSHNTFAVEHFLDEVCRATGQDPYQVRRTLLKDKPRHLAVLDAVARMARWGEPLPEGITRGIAFCAPYGSFVAQVVEAKVGADRSLALRKVYCAADCGLAVHPDLVKAQMESSIVFGLSSALFGEITLDKGQVRQSNFDDYPVLRMHQCPPMEISLLASREQRGGAGEPGVPCVAPALANAILAATGEPVRELPLSHRFTIA